MDLAHLASTIATSYTAPSNGAPSRIGQADTVQQVLEAVEQGNYIETAAELAGLSKQTIYNWMKRGEAGEAPYTVFMDAVKRASARAEAKAVANVRRAGLDDRFWAAEMTFLERRHPDKWARRQEGNEGPKVIVQIGVKDGDVQVQLASAPVPFALPEIGLADRDSL